MSKRKISGIISLGIILIAIGLYQLVFESYSTTVLKPQTSKKVQGVTSIITPARLASPSAIQAGRDGLGESVAGRPTSNLPSKIQDQTSNLFPVVRIVDGDTLVVRINNIDEKLRLIGIDTPESVDPRKTVQCFGLEASNKAKEILTNARISLESDPTQGDLDRYGRLLRYVFLEDGENFNLFMVREGYAHEYTYRLPYKYQAEFRAAETFARENKKGLWGAGCT